MVPSFSAAHSRTRSSLRGGSLATGRRAERRSILRGGASEAPQVVARGPADKVNGREAAPGYIACSEAGQMDGLPSMGIAAPPRALSVAANAAPLSGFSACDAKATDALNACR